MGFYQRELTKIVGKHGRGLVKPSFVYLMACGKFMKIGTAANPVVRLRQIQMNNPHEVELVAYVEGAKSVEQAVHQLVRHLHVCGEWFQYSDAVAIAFQDVGISPEHSCMAPSVPWHVKTAHSWHSKMS